MRVRWEFQIEQREESRGHRALDGPIHVHRGHVIFSHYEIGPRGWWGSLPYLLHVLRIDIDTGHGTAWTQKVPPCPLPQAHTFIETATGLYLHAGVFLSVEEPIQRLKRLPSAALVSSRDVSRATIARRKHLLYFSEREGGRLHCCDSSGNRKVWHLDLNNRTDHPPGPPWLEGDALYCFGRDRINRINPATGAVETQYVLKDVERVFVPARIGDDFVSGYVAHKAAGLLRYAIDSGRIVWRHEWKVDRAQRADHVAPYADMVIGNKKDRQIVALDAKTGSERWSFNAKSWIYSPIELYQDAFFFGSQSRFWSVDASSGRLNWSVKLKSIAAYYDRWEDSIIMGDLSGKIYRISNDDGRILDSLKLDAKVTGNIHVAGGMLYTILGGWESKPSRLIAVEL